MILEKLIATRKALQETIRKILVLNRTKKVITKNKIPLDQHKVIKSELKLLNKMAEKQAKMVRLYEGTLSRRKDSA
ncbi:MAG: hypothetical protein ACI9XO_000221 [Paraglaciecola sp.]|jgi:hypothetical protein